jgi:hypothetical protein
MSMRCRPVSILVLSPHVPRQSTDFDADLLFYLSSLSFPFASCPFCLLLVSSPSSPNGTRANKSQ